VWFIRSGGGTDPVGRLWCLDLATGVESLVADPAALSSAADEDLSTAERARRERTRETAGGVVGFATDRGGTLAAFAFSSRLWLTSTSGDARELPAAAPVVDPRPDPTGTHVAYASAGALRVSLADGSKDWALVEPDGPDVAWGVAEFIAAEELERYRGFWWAPDGTALLVARVDESPVDQWFIADPANPTERPREVAYPAAGTNNAVVTLHLVGLDGRRTPVGWDNEAFPYLVHAAWPVGADPLLLVMTRDQRRSQVLRVDVSDGAVEVLATDDDGEWLDVVPGTPRLLPDGRLLRTAELDGTRRLVLDGDPLTPEGLQVDHVIDVDASGVLVSASAEPVEAHVWRVGLDGTCTQLTGSGGYHEAVSSGGTTVLVHREVARPGVRVAVRRGDEPVGEIASYAEVPPVQPRPRITTVGERRLRVGLLLPTDHHPGTSLPVLMDPYGGPHGPRVAARSDRWLTSQWLADQGFAVVVADGRGTGRRGPVWDRSVSRHLDDIPLQDQVDALHAVAAEEPDLDLSRVGIRGWSFGGYLAALAVLRRPDVFHAAVAGAPVVDWRLYDTAYTERYLGHPDDEPAVYERHSLLTDAARLERPLLLIHGLADDNVASAHTLRLSSALLAAGRPHEVLPLSGVTHMTPQEVVAENLLLLQVDWLRDKLARSS
jgi:dipeptidyl-peptidase-4